VIGVRLVPLLAAAGHEVAGMTRSPGKRERLRAWKVPAPVGNRKPLFRGRPPAASLTAVAHERDASSFLYSIRVAPQDSGSTTFSSWLNSH
jgi:nucleoside-diphosphate-sugar epimerase